jgi:hypothetical protein
MDIGIYCGHLVYFMADWQLSGILVHFPPFWYFMSRSIWQPWPATRLQNAAGKWSEATRTGEAARTGPVARKKGPKFRHFFPRAQTSGGRGPRADSRNQRQQVGPKLVHSAF